MNGSVANPRFCEAAVGDFTGDGFVNGEDLGIMLGGWGACP